MFKFNSGSKSDDKQGIIDALNASQAVIEFKPNGEIITANHNFISAVGYRLDEIVGRHHSIFCDKEYTASPEYQRFWADLANGKFQAGEFKRFGKGESEIWLQASYNPIKNAKGEVVKVVKFASDITEQKKSSIDSKGKIEAIGRSQAVIEFNLDGTIITANPNFTSTLGYKLEEIVGKHHRIFCESSYASSADYQRFWKDLGDGRFQSDEFKRIGKQGNEIYIQASYNPIFDDTGKVVKVVKFATDITDAVKKRLRNDELSKEINYNLGDVVNQVSTASEMSDKAAAASTETEAIVNSVAAAAEEMSQSVKEISVNMNNAREKVEGAFTYTETANLAAENLAKSAASMNSIVSIINEIAGNINLLALNATIESARAGEAGRGFAVVASEVKALASQVSSSTQTIASEISNMQVVSNEVTQSLTHISNSMNEVLGNVSSVATAIDQQNAVTLDISNNMQQAVIAVSDISHSLVEINDAFGHVSVSSNKVKNDVEELAA